MQFATTTALRRTASNVKGGKESRKIIRKVFTSRKDASSLEKKKKADIRKEFVWEKF